MTYALGELLIYLIIAALLGLMVGYLLWYRRAVVAEAWAIEMTTECDRLRADATSQTVDAERSAKELEAIRGQVARLQPVADRVPQLKASLAKLEGQLNEESPD